MGFFTRIGMTGASARIARWTAAAHILVLALCVAPSPARASTVLLEWNQLALAATVAAGQGAVPQIRTMAIVHVSVHDAVNAVTGTYRTYLPFDGRPGTGSADAAAIAAAHAALVRLFPAQTESLNAARASSLAARGVSDTDPGIAVGERAAAAVLSVRASDGSSQAQFQYVAPGAGAPGVWTAIGTAQPNLPGWGRVTPWLLKSGSQFRPDAPPALGGRRYARDYDEVKELGSAASATRTVEQTDIARFWLASPSIIWSGIARALVQGRDLDASSAARVFALMYVAAADASIACWDAKYAYNFWRPQNAIRQGDLDGNDATVGDPSWAPLFPTPPHPEYLSGHAVNSSAMAAVLIAAFGDQPGLPIVATSPTTPGFERRWQSLTDGVEEVIDARIYGGLHFRTSDEVGVRVGRTVARFVLTHAMQPNK